jgi:DNA anti-recombination protein RmuC
LKNKIENFYKIVENVTNKLDQERKNYDKTMNEYVREQNEKYNILLRKKL